MIGEDASVNFIQEAIWTANVIGFRETTDILIKLRSAESSSLFREKVEIVVNHVMVDFKMDKSRLLGTAHDGEGCIARRFCYVLLRESLNCDISHLCSYFKRSKPRIYAEMRAFGSMDKNNRVDSITIERYEKIKRAILKKINNGDIEKKGKK